VGYDDRRVALGLYRTGLSRELLESALDVGVTAIDTAYSYDQFTSHRALSAIADDLLHRFEISTKVGFFPDGHDLSPARLRQAIERSTEELDRTPDVVLLHNPEQSPSGFLSACALLSELRDAGLCGSWGIASWDPEPLNGIVYEGPTPDILMVRVGLAVPPSVLAAGEDLFKMTQAADRWGMAPFGQDAAARLWSDIDPAQIVSTSGHIGRLEAAFAAAFELPHVSRIAVGTHRADHLSQLQAARCLATDSDTVARYRAELTAAAGVAASGVEQVRGAS
jgi:pyridoxine 4-dehydrogenase